MPKSSVDDHVCCKNVSQICSKSLVPIQVWCKSVPKMMPKSSVDVQVWCKNVFQIWSKSLVPRQAWCKSVPKMMPKSFVDDLVCCKNVQACPKSGQTSPVTMQVSCTHVFQSWSDSLVPMQVWCKKRVPNLVTTPFAHEGVCRCVQNSLLSGRRMRRRR